MLSKSRGVDVGEVSGAGLFGFLVCSVALCGREVNFFEKVKFTIAGILCLNGGLAEVGSSFFFGSLCCLSVGDSSRCGEVFLLCVMSSVALI